MGMRKEHRSKDVLESGVWRLAFGVGSKARCTRVEGMYGFVQHVIDMSCILPTLSVVMISLSF